MDKVVTSALVIIPPQTLWDPIQAIRSVHDKAYARWMPHINLLYPFVPESQFVEATAALTKAVANIKPLEITFAKFDYFEHGRMSCTTFLEPQTKGVNDLAGLQGALHGAFPHCDDLSVRGPSGFHGHLTVGQWPGKRATVDAMSTLQSGWSPITFTVDQVHIISRKGLQPFEIKHSIPLGTDLDLGYEEEGDDVDEDVAYYDEIAPLPEQNVAPVDPLDPLYRVVTRIREWLTNVSQSHSTHLPKTRDKLRSTIRPMCKLSNHVVVSAEDLLQLMIKDGFVALGLKDSVTCPKKDQPGKPVLPSVSHSGIFKKTELEIAQDKARRWLASPYNNPKDKAALINSLKQIGTMPHVVNDDDVMDQLINQNLVVVNDDDTVKYWFQ